MSAVRQSVSIHGVRCLLVGAPSGYRVVRTDNSTLLARAPSRFLAIAQAASKLQVRV